MCLLLLTYGSVLMYEMKHVFGEGFRLNTHRNSRRLIPRRERKASVELAQHCVATRLCVFLVMLEAFLSLGDP